MEVALVVEAAELFLLLEHKLVVELEPELAPDLD
jgi:hypothetical protein